MKMFAMFCSNGIVFLRLATYRFIDGVSRRTLIRYIEAWIPSDHYLRTRWGKRLLRRLPTPRAFAAPFHPGCARCVMHP
jgi:hypothetical protein